MFVMSPPTSAPRRNFNLFVFIDDLFFFFRVPALIYMRACFLTKGYHLTIKNWSPTVVGGSGEIREENNQLLQSITKYLISSKSSDSSHKKNILFYKYPTFLRYTGQCIKGQTKLIPTVIKSQTLKLDV